MSFRGWVVRCLMVLIGMQSIVVASDVHAMLHGDTYLGEKSTLNSSESELVSEFQKAHSIDILSAEKCDHCCHCHGGCAPFLTENSCTLPILISFRWHSAIPPVVIFRHQSPLFRPPINR